MAARRRIATDAVCLVPEQRRRRQRWQRFWLSQTGQPRQPRQRGAALITALLVVTLAAVLVAGLLWREQVEIRRVENQRLGLQLRWVSRGTFDLTRLVLRSEADSAPVTYLGGVWSVPIAETRLSAFLGTLGEAQDGQLGSIWLSGSIEDAQARFNLRNLAAGSGGEVTIDPVALATLKKLLSELGIDTDLATAIAGHMRLSVMSSAMRGQKAATGNLASDALAAAQAGNDKSGGFSDNPGLAGSDDGSATRPIQMHSVDALRDVPGVTAAIVDRLRPFVIVLPVPTMLNLNTAEAEVISAAIPGLSLPSAQAFVSARNQAFLINMGDAQNRFARYLPPTDSLDTTHFDVTSQFFIVHGRVRDERAVVNRQALIYRDARTHSTHIIQVSEFEG